MAESSLLTNDDPPAYRVVEPTKESPFLLTCDHAGRVIPHALGSLGLEKPDLERHIAWDIGAGALAERLAETLGAFLILQTYSRLVIDCNRRVDVETSIARVSEVTSIPGNARVTARDAAARAAEIFHPYHRRIGQELERRRGAALPTIYVAVHSFTPRFLEVLRPMHVGVLYNRDTRFAKLVQARLVAESAAGPPFVVGDNAPYSASEDTDYGVIQHAERQGLPYVEIEVRQDLIADDAGQRRWAALLSRVFTAAAADLGG
jgi:predicted N-formylglutamate amidohydrolase